MEEPSYLEELSQSSGQSDLSDFEETSVEEVLQRPITFRLFGSGEPSLVDFFVNHVEDLLNLTFFSDKKEISAKAFAILEHSKAELTVAMLDHQRFNNAACGVLSNIESGSLMLSRLSSLALAALYAAPHYIISSCGFILQLLSYVDDVSVFSLFESLCGDNINDIEDVQQWLIDIGFIQLLIKEIDTMPTEKLEKCGRDDRNGLLMVAYMNLIQICAKSPILRKEVKTPSVFAIINRGVCEWAPYVEDARWEALASVACKNTRDVMRALYQQCVEMLPHDKKGASRSVIAAIRILSFMVKCDPILVPFIVKAEIGKHLGKLMLINPDHSILHASCVNYLEAAISNPKTMKESLAASSKFIIDSLCSENRNLQATAFHLLTKISEAEKNDDAVFEAMNEIPGFVQTVKEPFSIYNSLLESEYGGPQPIISGDANGLVMKTMMMMRVW